MFLHIKENQDLTEQVGSDLLDYQLTKNDMSNLWNLDWKDLFNGIVTAILGAIITYLVGVFGALYQLVIAGEPFDIMIDLKAMIVIGSFAGLSYLAKRFFSDDKGMIFGSK